MACINNQCDSERIVQISAKCSDLCVVSMPYLDREHEGDIPDDLGIGGADMVELSFCLECGMLQGEYPRDKTELEQQDEDEEEYPDELSEPTTDD